MPRKGLPSSPESTMRIGLVSLDYKPYRSSGLTIYAEDLARGLTELGHAVTVLAARRSNLPTRQWMDGVRLHRLEIDWLDWISYSWRAAQLLHNLEGASRLDVVHFLDVHFAYAYAGPFVASLWQSFRQRLTARQGQPYDTGPIDWFRRQVYYRVARRWMERRSLAKADYLVAGCQSTRDEFVAQYGVPPDKVDLVSQGIDTTIFRPVLANDLRQGLGLKGCRVLLFMGFITPRKGLEYLGQAMRLLPKDVHLVVAGRWSRGYRPRFLRAVGSAVERVHEVGFVSDGERAHYYSMADVYVSPSLLEGLGITPIESLACGTPAVVTSASSGPEEVGDAGIVVPPCDAQALARAIRCLLDDDGLRQRLGRRGRHRVIRDFSYRRMAELTVQTYEKSLQRRHGS